MCLPMHQALNPDNITKYGRHPRSQEAKTRNRSSICPNQTLSDQEQLEQGDLSPPEVRLPPGAAAAAPPPTVP